MSWLYQLMSFSELAEKFYNPLYNQPYPYILFSISIAILAYMLSITHKDDAVTQGKLEKELKWFIFPLNYKSLFCIANMIVISLMVFTLIKIILDPYDIDVLIKYTLIFFVFPLFIATLFNLDILSEKKVSVTVKEEREYQQKKWQDILLTTLSEIKNFIQSYNKIGEK
jgi:hypothetical protein